MRWRMEVQFYEWIIISGHYIYIWLFSLVISIITRPINNLSLGNCQLKKSFDWFLIGELPSLDSSWPSDFSDAERHAILWRDKTSNDKRLKDKTSSDKTSNDKTSKDKTLNGDSKLQDDYSSSNNDVSDEQSQKSDKELENKILQKVRTLWHRYIALNGAILSLNE